MSKRRHKEIESSDAASTVHHETHAHSEHSSQSEHKGQTHAEHSEHTEHAHPRQEKVARSGPSKGMMLAGFVVVAVVFFAAGFMASSMAGYSSLKTGDQLIFISPPGCTDCGQLEPIAKSVASTLNVPFVKTGFSQELETPGFVLVYNNTFLTVTGFDTEPTFKNQICLLTKNSVICDQAQKLGNASANPSQPEPGATNVPKTDKPAVELFVMSFCPYGVQAEDAMKPVVDLLGGKADIKVKFIASVGGTTPDTVQSLHGPPEAMEDLRQVCIRQNYDYAKFWTYVSEIDANCYSIYRDAAQMDACWKAAALKAGIDAAAVDSCVNASSVNLIKADEATANGYGVSGSPTLIINGVKVQPSRTPEGYKQAVCSAFTTPPAECQQVLEGGSAQQPAGGCG